MDRDKSSPIVVIGAGPFGLAAACHLRAAGAPVRTFGKAMEFWDRNMPIGMKLRSPWEGSHISDPDRALTLDQYQKSLGKKLTMPLPLEDFVRYGQWFQQQALPDVDPRRVKQVAQQNGRFEVTLDDGEKLTAQRVVVAAGIGYFPNKPASFESLSGELVSHSSEACNRELGRFAGKRVAVVGGGQSAIESAALLHEAGAKVEVYIREPQLRWLRWGVWWHTWLHSWSNPFRKLMYPPGDIGPPIINWLIEAPHLFNLLPRGFRDKMAKRAIRPAASGWLKPRTKEVAIHTGRHIAAAASCNGHVNLQLDDGSQRESDHIFLGTGYRISLARYPFLSPELLAHIRIENGYPILGRGFESSVPGLHFVGATAAHSYGPICRFVAGTRYMAKALTRHIHSSFCAR